MKCIYTASFFKKRSFIHFLNLPLERGEGREKERERNINVWLPLACPLLGTWLATQACALSGNQTWDLSGPRPALYQLSHTSHGGASFGRASTLLLSSKVSQRINALCCTSSPGEHFLRQKLGKEFGQQRAHSKPILHPRWNCKGLPCWPGSFELENTHPTNHHRKGGFILFLRLVWLSVQMQGPQRAGSGTFKYVLIFCSSNIYTRYMPQTHFIKYIFKF